MNPFAAIDDITLVAADDGTVYAIDHNGPHPTNLTVEQVTDWNLYDLVAPTVEQVDATTHIWARTAAISPHLQDRGLWNDPGSGRFVRRGWSSLKWFLSLQNREQRLWKQARELDGQGSSVDVFLNRPVDGIAFDTPFRVREVFDQGTGSRAGTLRVEAPDGRSFLVRWSAVREVTAGRRDDRQIDALRADTPEPVEDRVAQLTASDFATGDGFRAATAGLVHTPSDADGQELKQPSVDTTADPDRGADSVRLQQDLREQAAMLSRFPMVDLLVEAVNAEIAHAIRPPSLFRWDLFPKLLEGSSREGMLRNVDQYESFRDLVRLLTNVVDVNGGERESRLFTNQVGEMLAESRGEWLADVFDLSAISRRPRVKFVAVSEDAPRGVGYGQLFLGPNGEIRHRVSHKIGVTQAVDENGEPVKVGDTVYLKGRIKATVIASEDDPQYVDVPDGPPATTLIRQVDLRLDGPDEMKANWFLQGDIKARELDFTSAPVGDDTVLLPSLRGNQLAVGDRVAGLGDESYLSGIVTSIDVVDNTGAVPGVQPKVIVTYVNNSGRTSTLWATGLERIGSLPGNAEFSQWAATTPPAVTGEDQSGRAPAAQALAERLIRAWADWHATAPTINEANPSAPSANEQIALALLSSINGAWADSSQSNLATGLQYAAAELAGGDAAADFPDWHRFIRNNPAFLEPSPGQLILSRAVALSTYLLTQETLREQGIGPDDMVLLWRGSSESDWITARDLDLPVRVRTNPLSASATRLTEAAPFGQVQLGMRVPASHVFSTAHTGPGTYREAEALILGSLSDGFAALDARTVTGLSDHSDQMGPFRRALSAVKADTAVDAAAWRTLPVDTARWFGALFGRSRDSEAPADTLRWYREDGLIGVRNRSLESESTPTSEFERMLAEEEAIERSADGGTEQSVAREWPVLDDDAGWAEWATQVATDDTRLSQVVDYWRQLSGKDEGSWRGEDEELWVDYLGGDRPDVGLGPHWERRSDMALAHSIIKSATPDGADGTSRLLEALFAPTDPSYGGGHVPARVLAAAPPEERPDLLNEMIAEMFQLGDRLTPDALFDALAARQPEFADVDRDRIRAVVGDQLARRLMRGLLDDVPLASGSDFGVLWWGYRPSGSERTRPHAISPAVDGRRYVMRMNAPAFADNPRSLHWLETSWVEATAAGDALIANYDQQRVERETIDRAAANVWRSQYSEYVPPLLNYWILSLSYAELLAFVRNPAAFADRYAAAMERVSGANFWPFQQVIDELLTREQWWDLRSGLANLEELQAAAERMLRNVRSSLTEELVAA